MAQKLFIGGLAFSTSNERLREVFTQAGAVESATVVTDRETGRSRGFGFVEMATAEEANAAVKKFNGQELDGRTLKVELANAKPSGGGARSGGGFNRVGGRRRCRSWRSPPRRIHSGDGASSTTPVSSSRSRAIPSRRSPAPSRKDRSGSRR